MLGAKKPRIASAGRSGNLLSESRVVRAPPTSDKLGDFVSNIQQIARIANGISLQAGLIDATMPVEDVISELLHMGSMKPNTLMAVNPAEIKQLMNETKTAMGKLDGRPMVTSFENSYLQVGSAMKADDFQITAGGKEYERHFDEALNTKLVSADFVQFENGTKHLSDYLKNVKKFKSDVDATQAAKEVGELRTLYQSLEQVEKTVSDAKFQDLISYVAGLKLLREKSAFLELLFEEHHARYGQAVTYPTKIPLADVAAVSTNFQVFEKLSNSFGKHLDVLSNLYSFVKTRQSGRQSGAQYTAGLPDGVKDLENLSVDIDDKWFQQVVGGQTVSEDFKKSFLPLEGLKMNVRKVENAWQSAGARIKSAEALVRQQSRIASQAMNVASISTKMPLLPNCSNQFPFDAMFGPYWKPQDFDSIRELNRDIDLLPDFRYARRLFADLSVLKRAVNFTGLSTAQEMENATPNMVRKLKAMPEVDATIGNVQEYLGWTKSTSSFLAGLPSRNATIKNAIMSVDTCHRQVMNSNFTNWKDCSKNVLGSDGEVVGTMIEAIRELVSMGKAQEVSDAEASLEAFLNSAHLLKSVQSSAQSMKGVKTLESKTMSQLKKDVSSRLGLAAQGLEAIHKAENNRKKLDALMADMKFVDLALPNRQFLLTREDFSRVKSLNTLRISLIAMFEDIDEFKPSVDSIVWTDLKSYKPVLDAAAKIRGVKVDAEKLKKAIKTLEVFDPLVIPKFINVTGSLDTLAELDLDFSSYQMSGASGAIDDLDTFFQNWSKSLTESKKEALQKVEDSSEDNAQNNADSSSTLLLIVGGILLVALLIGLIVGAVFLIKKSKKEKLKKMTEAEDKSREPQTDTKPNDPESPKGPVQKGNASTEDATKGVSFSAEQTKSPNAKSPVAVSPGAKKVNQLPLIENRPLKDFQKDIMPLDTSEQDGKKMVDDNGEKGRSEEQCELSSSTVYPETSLDISEKMELDGLMAVEQMTETMKDNGGFGLADLEQFEKLEGEMFAGYAFDNFSEMMNSEEPWKRMTIECY